MLALGLGVLVGAVLGLTGAGGSIMAVPLLMWGMDWTLPQAAPVALIAVCASSGFGTITAWDVTYVRYRAALLMAFAGLLTASFGLYAGDVLPVNLLTGLFAAVLVYVGVRMFLQALKSPAEAAVVRASLAGDGTRSGGPFCRMNADSGRINWDRPCAACLAVTGGVTGFLAGLLGVGGGFVIVPALRAMTQMSMHSAIATSLMAISLTSAATVGIAVLQGRDLPWMVALPFVLGALIGMLGGRKLAPRVAGPHLQQGFAAMMLVVAVGMGSRALGWI